MALPTKCETPIHLPILPSVLAVWFYQYQHKFVKLIFCPFWYVNGVPCQYFCRVLPILTRCAWIDFCLTNYNKIPYVFWYPPLYSSPLILVIKYFYHPLESVLPMRVWFRCPTINATATCVFPVVMSLVSSAPLHYLILGCLGLQYPLSLHSKILQLVD